MKQTQDEYLKPFSIKMNISSKLFFLTFLFLQSCMVARYDIRNELKNNPKNINMKECGISYTVSLDGDYKKYKKEMTDKIKRVHILFANEIFSEHGCDAKYVENESDANFSIEIKKPPFLGASGQDYLNVFSFGLIPTWETREDQIYTFYNKKINAQNTYYIDYKNYNHLIFLPFFWTMFYTVDEGEVFKKSLRNFFENS